MDVLKELESWFLQRDYETGLIILAKFSKNRILLQNLNRKPFPEKLYSELKKLAEHHKLRIGNPSTQPPTPDPVTQADKQPQLPEAQIEDKLVDNKLLGLETAADEILGMKLSDTEDNVESLVNEKLSEMEMEAEDIISDKMAEFEHLADEYLSDKRKSIERNRHVNFDDLPKHLQELWQINRNAYNEIRALHEKLKLMEKLTPEERQPFTERIASLDEMIRTNWEAIDAWSLESEPTQKDPGDIDHKRINANRKYISTGLKKLQDGKLSPVKVAELKKNMKGSGAVFGW